MKRRTFLQTSTMASLIPLISQKSFSLPIGSPGKPISIASGNGLQATAKAMEIILKGGDALDGVIAGVNIVEDDPNDNSVGYGGLPNEDGVVELDSSVMHGPTHRGGAVASLQNIKNPSKVARFVMERTDHVLLVGEGALKFAKMHGFKEENLLTEESRKEWVKWKELLSKKDDYLPPHAIDDLDIGANLTEAMKTYGTINCLGLDLAGNISGVTTTSGLSYKIPGRVGDSPIIGAGLYVDNEIGAAGSTGRGEANLLDCSSFLIVESMRQGMSPTDACLVACKRITTHTKEKRLLTKEGRPTFNVSFYAINKKGEYGSAAIYEGVKFAVNDGKESRLETAVGYFKIRSNED